MLFLEHGFSLWNNFWYAGRYSFVNYSILYYPLAAVVGIRLLGVVSISVAALAFAVVTGREFGRPARWSLRAFALVWPGMVIAGAYPFALGAALALLAGWALRSARHWRFALLTILALAASPLAFLLLALLLAGLGIGRRVERRSLVAVAATALLAGAAEVVLLRAFSDGGRYPFPAGELGAGLLFCTFGAALTWRVASARPLRAFFPLYLVACVAAFAVPSELGENVLRLRFAAIPIGLLLVSLRSWRPLLPCLGALALATSWNLTPLRASWSRGTADPAAAAGYWRGTIRYLHAHLSPSYRVEAVDTGGHWPALYLPSAGIPLARGWYRQSDFPQNAILYTRLGRRVYLHWLRSLGVRYVVATSAPPDYSARAEAKLIASGRSGLRVVWRSAHATILAVPAPRRLVTGEGGARVTALEEARIRLDLDRPGSYRIAVRWSPYWHVRGGCIAEGADSMIRVRTTRSGPVDLRFDVDAEGALASLAGRRRELCG